MTNTEITKSEAGTTAKSNSTRGHAYRRGSASERQEQVQDDVLDAEDVAIIDDFELVIVVIELQNAIDELCDPYGSRAKATTSARNALQRIRDLRRKKHAVSHARLAAP